MEKKRRKYKMIINIECTSCCVHSSWNTSEIVRVIREVRTEIMSSSSSLTIAMTYHVDNGNQCLNILLAYIFSFLPSLSSTWLYYECTCFFFFLKWSCISCENQTNVTIHVLTRNWSSCIHFVCHPLTNYVERISLFFSLI